VIQNTLYGILQADRLQGDLHPTARLDFSLKITGLLDLMICSKERERFLYLTSGAWVVAIAG